MPIATEIFRPVNRKVWVGIAAMAITHFMFPSDAYSQNDGHLVYIPPTKEFNRVDFWEWDLDPRSDVVSGDHGSDPSFERSVPWDNVSMKATVRAGEHLGASGSLYFPNRTEEVYVSYCIRFADNWHTYAPGGKLPGFAGNSSPENGGQGGNPANGYNAWSARMMFGPSQWPDGRIPVGFYVYHRDQSYQSQYGDVEWWANDEYRLFQNTVKLERNKWYRIRQHIRINDPWVNNGVLRAWLDGEKVYSRENFNFTNAEEFREVYRFWLNLYHGGSSKAPNDLSLYIDQFTYSFGLDTTKSECLN